MEISPHGQTSIVTGNDRGQVCTYYSYIEQPLNRLYYKCHSI